MSVNAFIDTNIFLDSYKDKERSVKILTEINGLVTAGELCLYLPKQVISEFNRNREKAINQYIWANTALSFPQPYISTDPSDLEGAAKKRQELIKTFNEMKIILAEKIANNKLECDKIVASIFANSKVLESTPALLEKARIRKEIGNPPGKEGSLGDSLIWETLLEYKPDGVMYFISKDKKHFASPLDQNNLLQFLNDEWEETKKCSIVYYSLLSKYLQEVFKEKTAVTEEEVKEEASESGRIHYYAGGITSVLCPGSDYEYESGGWAMATLPLEAEVIGELKGNTIIKCRCCGSVFGVESDVFNKDLERMPDYSLCLRCREEKF